MLLSIKSHDSSDTENTIIPKAEFMLFIGNAKILLTLITTTVDQNAALRAGYTLHTARKPTVLSEISESDAGMENAGAVWFSVKKQSIVTGLFYGSAAGSLIKKGFRGSICLAL